ncbi:hypothetical protein F4774DRAFT_419780 [Daldinia eschscholtzii]|nr:hypothetical protein F4774DRAFT_419780 [Daldinia eschscholtzii]
MARKVAKSVATATKRAIAGEIESQDSQDMLEMHMLRHGVGVLLVNDALPILQQPDVANERTGEMSSESPTQSNDGRSYEQYNDNSEPQSISQASSFREHPTLQENDTGYLNFRRTHYNIPDSVPEGNEEEAERDHADNIDNAVEKSQPTQEASGTNGRVVAPPQTPSITQKLFQHHGDGTELIPPSQLFGQTQWTSAVRKASPTSSRPSPDVFNQNTISPNPVASSPLKHKGLRRISSRPSDEKTPPVPTNSNEDEGTNQRNVEEPLPPHFEMSRRRTQSLETETTDPSSQVQENSDSDSESDLEKASKSFPSVTLPRRPKSFQGRNRTIADPKSQETVADSQEHLAPPQHTKTGPIVYRNSNVIDSSKSQAPNSNTEYRETIPETSPPGTSSETEALPQKEPSAVSNLPEQPSLGSAGRKHKSTREQTALNSSPSILARPKDVTTPVSTRRNSPPASDPRTGTSTLSTLSATPNPDVELEDERHSSQSLRSSLPQIKAYSRSRESLRRTTRYSSVSTDELARSSPLSTSDKNERKPPIRKLARQSITNQDLFQTSTANQGIFKGMVFALSFQGPQTRKNKGKPTDRAIIERMIRQEGGQILSDGFDELFRFDSFQIAGNNTSSRDLSSSLTLLDQDTGFTALIADGHSRKVKYMQALALGIPCLAPKWIMNCISKREIIDWSSYLLCAGPSTLLGEAIRSRNLQPYDASTAKLVDVVNERPKLLHEARILLVMKKTKNEGKKLPYVFLAQVLGGSLVRVYSLEEARMKLRDEESQNRPFDWVYVDDSLHNAQDALFGSTTGGNTATKKRKRQSTGSEEADPPPKRIRTLTDELVIQSLILGRLIEDGEMEE